MGLRRREAEDYEKSRRRWGMTTQETSHGARECWEELTRHLIERDGQQETTRLKAREEERLQTYQEPPSQRCWLGVKSAAAAVTWPSWVAER